MSMYRYSIFIPSTEGKRHVDSTPYVRMVLGTLSRIFGGATVEQAHGGYLANDGTLVVENVSIVWTLTDREVSSLFRAMSKALRTAMQQESVLWTRERVDVVEFVDTD